MMMTMMLVMLTIRDDDIPLQVVEHLTTITITIDIIMIIIRDDDFPLELAEHLTLEQCESLIPSGPGGWRKVIIMIMMMMTNVVMMMMIRSSSSSSSLITWLTSFRRVQCCNVF